MPKNTLPKGTTFINRKVAQSIFKAFDFAEATDTALDTYIVIQLHETEYQSAQEIFRKIVHKYRDWLAYQSKGVGPQTPRYTRTFEATGAQPHVNWVVHVPASLKAAFKRKLPKWIEKVQGTLGPFDLWVRDITPGTHKTVAKYILKGVDPEFVDHFHLQRIHAPQGEVWGIRASASRSLGKAARDAAGFRKRRTGRRAVFVRSGDSAFP